MKTVFNVLFVLIAAQYSQADMIYNISLPTEALVGNPNGPFALDFQLTSGDTSSGIVNSATLSEFSFGVGGSGVSGQPFPNSGNATGSLSSIVSLTTAGSSFFNELSQNFVAGDILSFQLDLTNNPQTGPTPDEFTFQLIDSTAGEVPTTDPSGSNALLIIDLSGTTLSPQIYMTNGDGLSISPEVSSAVPEPRTDLFVLTAIAFFALSRGRTGLANPHRRSS